MDLVTLASAATAALTPYLVKAGEKIASDVANNLPEQVDKLWGMVIAKFQGKPAAEGAAQELAANAGDPDNQEAFNLQLKKALREDPAFAEQLAALLAPKKDAAQVSNTGSGAIALGGRVAVSASGGGIAVGGNVGYNIVIGSHNHLIGENRPEQK
jgi:hypothetical protein